MCLEDVRLGRKEYYRRSVVPVGNATVQIAEANHKRVGLIIGGTDLGTPAVGPGTVAGDTEGYIVRSQSPPIVARIEEWGQAVTDRWTGFYSGGPSNVVVTEVFLEQE